MKKMLYNLKKNINLNNSKFYKLYLSIFSLLNLAYLSLEIYKFKLWKSFSLMEEIQPLNYNKTMSITHANGVIERLMICVNLLCLIILIIKKNNINTKQFLTIHIVYLFFASIFSYILSIIFSTTIGNLIEQLFAAYTMTFVVLLYYILKNIRKTLYEKSN